MLLARIGGGLVSWKHDLVGDCDLLNLGNCDSAFGDLCLAAMDLAACVEMPVVIGCSSLVCSSNSQSMAFRSTDASY